MSYLKSRCDQPLVDVTLGQLLDDTAAKWPEREAYVFRKQGLRITFPELKEQANQLAAGLMSIGVGRGDVVGWVMSTRPEWIALCFAVSKIGAIAMPLSPEYFLWTSNNKEITEHALQKAKLKVLVMENHPASEHFEGTVPFLFKMFPETMSSNSRDLAIEKVPSLSSIVIIGDRTHENVFYHLEDMKTAVLDDTAGKRLQLAQRQTDCHDTVFLTFTSGSTGVPKCVEHSSHTLINNSGLHAKTIGMNNKNMVLHSIDLTEFPWAFLFSLTEGCTLVLPSDTPPTASEVLSALLEERCEATSFMYVKTLHDLVNDPELKTFDLTFLEQVTVGGNVVSKRLQQDAATVFPNADILTLYGTTETLHLATTIADMTDVQRQSTVGHLLPHLEMKLVDRHGQIVPLQHEGEVWVRGYSVFKCYRGDEEKTAEAKTAEGWYKTGDIGILDENGLLKIVGRIKDVILKNAEIVYPAMVERVLQTHPKVLDVKVVGVPDPANVEEICACIILKNGHTLQSQEMREHSEANGLLEEFTPGYFVFMKSFPKTSTGRKVDRKRIRALAMQMLALQEDDL
ncbi:medium-chain acyl-CoA ligase ACSF2, mitochondrial-like isoform X1 [Branchiostoma floridae]|uniref:Medium-chain acyl-CoA ligase ACSF2, mitochondrial-like isoform X1 n=1 Tax=Branchiostoma floridae TaxID=7739 RepID=A0A9J7KZR5_BRAFL|nr:medium-chain acyl-CoA ligase ACSF2, mitochondrial-like isoform X1 [Branchiostoma floridae]